MCVFVDGVDGVDGVEKNKKQCKFWVLKNESQSEKDMELSYS